MHQLVHGMTVMLILFWNSLKILVVLIQLIHKLLEMLCVATQFKGKLSSYSHAPYVKMINQLCLICYNGGKIYLCLQRPHKIEMQEQRCNILSGAGWNDVWSDQPNNTSKVLMARLPRYGGIFHLPLCPLCVCWNVNVTRATFKIKFWW
jgi:hypothetical protein